MDIYIYISIYVGWTHRSIYIINFVGVLLVLVWPLRPEESIVGRYIYIHLYRYIDIYMTGEPIDVCIYYYQPCWGSSCPCPATPNGRKFRRLNRRPCARRSDRRTKSVGGCGPKAHGALRDKNKLGLVMWGRTRHIYVYIYEYMFLYSTFRSPHQISGRIWPRSSRRSVKRSTGDTHTKKWGQWHGGSLEKTKSCFLTFKSPHQISGRICPKSSRRSKQWKAIGVILRWQSIAGSLKNKKNDVQVAAPNQWADVAQKLTVLWEKKSDWGQRSGGSLFV